MPAMVHRRGEGEHHGVGSSEVLIKATGDDTAGSFFLSETTIEPGFPGPPPHHHERLHDMFYVLDGVLTMQLGEDTLQFEAGTFVCVPPGVKHTFSNPSDTAVRFLNFNTPAGWEGYMRDLAAAAKTARSRRRRSDASPPITTFTRAEPHAIATLCAERP